MELQLVAVFQFPETTPSFQYLVAWATDTGDSTRIATRTAAKHEEQSLQRDGLMAFILSR
jgi:hypothetical protein